MLSTLFVAVALAGGAFYIEGPPTEERAEAHRVVEEALDAGLHARVVHRYRHGTGWEYVARVEGLDEEERALEVAADLAERAGVPLTVYVIDDDRAHERAAVRPEHRADAGVGPEIAARIIQAHGGVRGGAQVLRNAETVRLRYRRTLASGLVAVHDWARRGTDYALTVTIEAGEGRGSRVTLTEAGGWVEVDGEAPVPREAVRVRKLLDQLGPESVFGLALVVAPLGERLEGAVVSDTGLTLHLAAEDATASFGAEDFLLHELVGLGFRRAWSEWRAVEPHLIVPWSMEYTVDGRIVDQVEILELEVGVDLPDALFAPRDG